MNVIGTWCVYDEWLEELVAFVMTFFMKHGDGGKCFFFGCLSFEIGLYECAW
jgi:hypothetical protein